MPAKRPPPKRVEESESDEEILTEDEDFSDEGDEDEEEVDLIEVMNDMSLDQRRKVYAVKGYANEYNALMAKFREEVATLELELLAKRAPIFEERRKIVLGEREPTEEEVKAAKSAVEAKSKVEEIESDEDEAKPARKGVKVVAPKDTPEDGKGVPAYWLHALQNNEMIKHTISDRDEQVLKHLQDITVAYLDDKPLSGFELTFHFGENPFFTNKTLTKTCKWDQDRKGADTEQIDKLIGCKIDWVSSTQNVTVITKEKKQRHKSGKVRVVKREEKTESFFHFFNPLEISDEGEVLGEVGEEEDPEEMVQMDEDMTLAIANNIVPRATFFYTGESVEMLAKQLKEQFGGLQFGGDDDDEEFEDDEEDEDEEEDEAPPARRGGRRGGAGGGMGRGRGGHADPQQDCKQQ